MMLYLIQVLFALLQGGISPALSLLQTLAICVCTLQHLRYLLFSHLQLLLDACSVRAANYV
jgi:hypothetical protein